VSRLSKSFIELTYTRHDIAEKRSFGIKQQSFRCHFTRNIVFCQPGLILPDFTRFEVDREIVNYFSYIKKIQKETNIAENSKQKESSGVPNKYSERLCQPCHRE
jgi:hypothetical protein